MLRLFFSGRDDGTEAITNCAPFTLSKVSPLLYELHGGAIDGSKNL